MTGPSIVQLAGSPGQTGENIVFTLDDEPAPGNILVAFCSYSQHSGDNTLTPPGDAWTLIDDVLDGGNGSDSLATYWYEVQDGDGKTWTFEQSNTGDWASGGMYEVTVADTSNPVDQHGYLSYDTNTLTFATPSVTPSGDGELGLSAATIDYNLTELGSVSDGWTGDAISGLYYHQTWVASLDDLTSGGTPVSNTFTASDNETVGVALVVLIAPAASGTDADVAGVAATVTAAGGHGTPSASAGISGAAAAVTAAGGTGTPSGSADTAGAGAAVTAAGGTGTPSGSADVTGTGATVTAAGGTGTPSGSSGSVSADVTGVAAAMTAAGGDGTAGKVITIDPALLGGTARNLNLLGGTARNLNLYGGSVR